LQKYLQQNLQMDVERLDSLGAGAPSDPKLVPTFNENMLSVVSAYGLALQAMGDTKVTSSLLPAKIRREKMWKEKTKWFGAAAALFVLGTGLVAAKWLYLDMSQRSGQNTYAPQIDQVKGPAMTQDQQWSTIESAGGEDRTKVAELRKLDAHRQLWRNLIVDIYNAIPTPQKELLSGDPTDIKKIPRKQRKLIQIDSMDSRYVAESQLEPIVKSPPPEFARWAANGNAPQNNPPPEGAPPMDNPDAANLGNGVTQPSSRGFLITMKVTTPFDTALDPNGLIEKELIGNLMKIKPDQSRPKMEYAVARVQVLPPKRVKQDADRLSRIRTEYEAMQKAMELANPKPPEDPNNPGASGTPGAPATPPGLPPPRGTYGGQWTPPGGTPAGAQVDADLYKDPVLGETVIDDWEVTLLIAVVIDPPAPTAPAADAPAPGSTADAR
jgi:hypothetical protein